MKKSAVIFLLAVLLPSVVLGWLALRTAAEQQIILERRTAELYQSEADNLASRVRGIIDDQRRTFAETVRRLLAASSPKQLAQEFASALPRAWERGAIGFAIASDGRILSPTANDAATNPLCKDFLWDNGQFLSSRMAVVCFPVAVPDLSGRKKADANQSQLAVASKTGSGQREVKEMPVAQTETAAPLQSKDQIARNVAPQQILALSDQGGHSQLAWAMTDFHELTVASREGMVTRFVQDRLEMIFWIRPDQAPDLVFGCLLDAGSLRDLWSQPLSAGTAGPQEHPEFILALLNDKAQPVSLAPKGAAAQDWKHPFVASEIGEALPHWEAALYLARPEQIRESARGLRRTVGWLIAAALAAIACGGWMVVADARRQLALAQQKTDFVSNVSHELKTPLTSIRMFAELIQSGRAQPDRHSQYLRIIIVESERLTRLINNVLDFARIGRRQEPLAQKRFDLYALVQRIWEHHEVHLRENGFETRCRLAAAHGSESKQSSDLPDASPESEAVPRAAILGDEDAIAQILVNLLSNAEKYSGERKEIELECYSAGGIASVSVLDRGIGVPEGQETRIFDAFYRAHDSLSSGIQGSGLGLTLARRHAREHGGDIVCERRPGGGAIFTLRLPLAPATPAKSDAAKAPPPPRTHGDLLTP